VGFPLQRPRRPMTTGRAVEAVGPAHRARLSRKPAMNVTQRLWASASASGSNFFTG
jgi:hypothetical protein